LITTAPIEVAFFFVFNKDADTMQCPGGALASYCYKRRGKSGNESRAYTFNKKVCSHFPLAADCKVAQSKTNVYSITVLGEKYQERPEFEKTEAFRERLQIRKCIEEKNGEMKVAHGLRRADSTGLAAMRLQTYFTAFTVNVKRIVKLMSEKPDNNTYASPFSRKYFTCTLQFSYLLAA
jgi:hypothetical protein